VQIPKAFKNINGPPTTTFPPLVVALMETIVVSVDVSVTVVCLSEGTTIAMVPDITIAATMMAATMGATRARPVAGP
jgi:hypothetical protein